MSQAETMRTVVLMGHGDIDQLVYHDDWPAPTAGPNDVLIKVHACGLNNTDVNTRTAWYSSAVRENTTGGAFENADDDDATWGAVPLTFPRIQGADVVGTVIAVGDNADQALLDKRVLVDPWLPDWDNPEDLSKMRYFGSEADGAFADYTVVDHRNVHPIMSDLSHAELATFATSYVTAENMLNRAQVGAEDTVLISGASGGVGSALIQLANRRGAKTLAMASVAKHEALKPYNPTALLPRDPEDLGAAVKAATGEEKVSVVADVVGGALFNRFLDVLARGGRYTCSGAIAGPIVELDLRQFYLNDMTFTGATIAPPPTFSNLVGYIERGEIKPVLAETFPLKDLKIAQQAFIDKKHTGNIVVTMD